MGAPPWKKWAEGVDAQREAVRKKLKKAKLDHYADELLWLSRVVLCSLLFALCACEGHWEEVEKVTGYRGKARVNPFLAAERVLDELGHDAERKLFLSKMPDYDAVMILSAEGGLSEGRTKQVFEWVENGGHLIYCLGGSRAYNDHATGLELGMRVLNDVLVEEGDPLLRDLGIKVKKWDPKNIEQALKQDRQALRDRKGPQRQKGRKRTPGQKGCTMGKRQNGIERELEAIWRSGISLSAGR